MIKKECPICKKIFYSYPCERRIYCGQKCYGKSKKGKPTWNKGKKRPEISRENHYRWSGGRRKNSNGYILIFKPNNLNCDCNGYISEHRLVVEKCLKRYLVKGEEIHHINGIRDDNRPDNLYLFPSVNEHMKFHWDKRKGKCKELVSNLI